MAVCTFWLEFRAIFMYNPFLFFQALWDQARKLKKREIDELEREFGSGGGSSRNKKQKSNVDRTHMLNLLRENYTRPLNYELGQSILNHKWSELLYHSNRYMQRGSLMENYAIKKLQEQIICQVMTDRCGLPNGDFFFLNLSNVHIGF